MRKETVALRDIDLVCLCSHNTISRLPRWLSGKNLPAMQKASVRPLGWEDPLEKGMATHSSIRTWEIPWTEEPDGLQPMGIAKSQTRLRV